MAQIPSVVSDAAVRGAYGQAKALNGGTVAPKVPDAGPSFADMIRQATTDAVQTVRSADATIQAGLQGKVGTQQIVEATMAMESTVKLSVALRDKLVSAYQQIMQMQI